MTKYILFALIVVFAVIQTGYALECGGQKLFECALHCNGRPYECTAQWFSSTYTCTCKKGNEPR